MTTLTREALLNKAKPRYEVVDIPGVGKIGIRSVSELQKSRRDSRSVDASGALLKDYAERARAFAFIDQLMVDEETPMFSESDVEEIQAMDHAVTRPLFHAIKMFNGEEDARKKAESGDSEES